ncbi:hypothetical protein [Sulfurimonas sp.]|uniref:hypothetical protein n=1 Tax=Sulfurimonas sp. TaxID=2022749 RepID=UPI003569D9F1
MSLIKSTHAQVNLDSFIESSKSESIFLNSDIKFNDNTWDLEIEKKASKTITRAIFSTFDYAKISQVKMTEDETKEGGREIVFMQNPYLDFAKAYFVNRFSNNPTKSITNIIVALRVIEKALHEMGNNINPINIDNDILNKAVEITKENYAQSTGYGIGQKLEEIANFLTKKNLVNISIDWLNSIKRPNDKSGVGKEADKNRNERMPSQAALDAIPEIFNIAKTPYEIISSSIIALLFCAPNRINEVFLAPFDIEVFEKIKNKDFDDSTDTNSNEYKEAYGLRWFPAKGAEPTIKWVIPSMADTAKEVIRKLKKLTASAREVALWYENNPSKLFLLQDLEYLRNTHLLNIKEISFILYGVDNTNKSLDKKRSSIHVWLKKHSILTTKLKGKIYATYKDVEKSILSLLPKEFPYVNTEIGLKYSETLIIQRKYEYNDQRDVIIPTIQSFTHAFIADALGAREAKSSLFTIFDYKEKNGSLVQATSHQFRHFLNTLAQKGGASQLDIAKWSGRADIQQNKDYDHLSPDDMLLMIRDSIGDEDKMIGPLAKINDVKAKVIISRDEFAQLKVPTAHLTEFGICIHDYTMSPCQLHRDCMNCTEQVCMKGDTERTDNIKKIKIKIGELLQRAIKAQSDSKAGANRWVEHHDLAFQRFSQLCDLLDDPSVPEGSFIQLSNIPVVSPISQAKLRRESNTDSSEFNYLKELLLEKEDENE